MDTNFLKDNKIISIPNFFKVEDRDRVSINRHIERCYQKYYGKFRSYNFPVSEYNGTFFEDLYKKFYEESRKILGPFTRSRENSKVCWMYRSSANDYNTGWHHHKNTSTISGIYYYQTQRGDSVSFKNKFGKTHRHFVREGELLIHPDHLLHTAEPPCSNIPNRYRYSIVIEIMTEETSEELFSRI